jgi:ferritin-like metal-binding protein YciE
MKKNTALDLLFETTLRHLYTAENEISKELEVLSDNAKSEKLKTAFDRHKEETDRQISRLKRVFKILEIDIKSSKLQGLPTLSMQSKELLKTMLDMNFTDRSKGIHGILGEGRELLRHFAETDIGDAALAGAGLKVENFEIACYRLVILLANQYSQSEIGELMKASLDEETRMSETLIEIAEEELQAAEGSLAS